MNIQFVSEFEGNKFVSETIGKDGTTMKNHLKEVANPVCEANSLYSCTVKLGMLILAKRYAAV
jgi:hypothetical protein